MPQDKPQKNASLQSKKHVCIFEMERKGEDFTGDVVCIICGVKLYSAKQAASKETC